MKKNINDLTATEKADFFHKEFEKKSRFQNLFNNSYATFPCQEFYQKFRNKIAKLLVQKNIVAKIDFPLEELHLHIPQELKDYNFNDGVNKITSFFYENDEEFDQIYFDFIKNFLRKKFDFPFYFQRTTTIRIHCPGGKNANHYPRYHTDIGYGHPAQEVNFWFAFTKPIGEQKHGFRVMNLENSLNLYRKYGYDFTPFIKDAIESKEFNSACTKLAPEVDPKEGELLAFDSRCTHSGEELLNHTRISMDIRIISVEDYQNLPIIYQGAGRRKILFAPGTAENNCYHELSSDKL